LPEFVARPCPRPDQQGAVCLGPVFAAAVVARSCICNADNALGNRHLKRAPPVMRRVEVSPRLVEAIVQAYGIAHPPDRLEWLAKWPESKRVAILRSEYYDDDKPARVTATIKREFSHKNIGKDRLIQAYASLRTQSEISI
jgi:hypothetical protein